MSPVPKGDCVPRPPNASSRAEQLEGVVPQVLPNRAALGQDSCTVATLCTADVGGNDVRTEVEVTDADYNVHWETIDYLYKSTTIGHMLSDQVSKEIGSPVNVVCGRDVFIVIPVGGTFECSATSVRESKSGTVVVTPENEDAVDWRLVGW